MTSRSRSIRLLILLLLAPAVVLPLLVGLYDRVEPTLGAFPFYFWFQMAAGRAVLRGHRRRLLPGRARRPARP